MPNLIPTEHWDYTIADTIRGLRTAFSSSTSDSIEISGLGRTIAVRSARAGIVLALKALGLGEGATIGVPLYCCSVVFRAIVAAGCRPRFIDVDPKTYCISARDVAAKSQEIQAVIAVHMFGNVCGMPDLRTAAPGKPLIEDCAQALGSSLAEHPAGSFGDIAVFSSRSGKYLSVGEGGAIYCHNAEVESRVAELVRESPGPTRKDECVHVIATYLRSLLRRRPFWGWVGERLWSAYGEHVSYGSQARVVIGKIHRTDLAAILRRLQILFAEIEKQRSNAEFYLTNLNVRPNILSFETPGSFFNRLQFPLLMPTPEDCEQVGRALRQKQISTSRPYKDIVEIAATHYGYQGDCPDAERIARTVLVIPCNYALSSNDVEFITRAFNSTWAEIVSTSAHTPVPHTATKVSRGSYESVAESHHPL